MTALTAPAPVDTTGSSAASRLRTVLLEDGVVTAAVGVAVVLAASPLADQLPGTPLVMRVLGAVLVVVGADLVIASRWTGRRLALAGTVVGELALAWAVGTALLVAVVRPDAPVAAAVLVVAAVTLAFGVTELRLVRALRR